MKNLSKKQKVIAVVCGVLILVVLVVTVLFAVLRRSDKAKLLEAATKLVNELDAQGVGAQMEQMDTLIAMYSSGQYEADMNISLRTQAYPKKLTLSGTYLHDQGKKHAQAICSVGIDGQKAIDAELFANESELTLQMPDLADAGFIFPLKEYGKKYNQSVLAKIQKNTLPEDFEVNLFENTELPSMKLSDCYSIYGTPLLKIITAAKVTLLEDKETYEVVLPKEIVEKAMDKKGVTLEDDMVFYTVVDEENNICEIENMASPIEIEGNAFVANVVFERGERSVRNKSIAKQDERKAQTDSNQVIRNVKAEENLQQEGMYEKSESVDELTRMNTNGENKFDSRKQLTCVKMNVQNGDVSVAYGYEFAENRSNLLVNFQQNSKARQIEFAGIMDQENEGQVKIEQFALYEEGVQKVSMNGLVTLRSLSNEIVVPSPKKEYRIFEMDELDMIMMLTEVGVKGFAKLLMIG